MGWEEEAVENYVIIEIGKYQILLFCDLCTYRERLGSIVQSKVCAGIERRESVEVHHVLGHTGTQVHYAHQLHIHIRTHNAHVCSLYVHISAALAMSQVPSGLAQDLTSSFGPM